MTKDEMQMLSELHSAITDLKTIVDVFVQAHSDNTMSHMSVVAVISPEGAALAKNAQKQIKDLHGTLKSVEMSLDEARSILKRVHHDQRN